MNDMRLNKYIAQAGICSRRRADELTEEGKVRINGAVMKTPGYDVQENDIVEVEGQIIEKPERLVYYALNKPVGFITTTSDEQDRPTVLDLMTEVSARVFPVGRLDENTSGLLIMTNDGDLSYHIAHPSHHVYKTYIAKVEGEVSKKQLAILRSGVDIGDPRKTAPALVEYVRQEKTTTTLEIRIYEGRNRQVRRMCKAIGHPVIELQRTAIGNIFLGHMHEGHYRKLTPQEIDYLKHC